MSIPVNQYEYNFEIENILTQFIALIDNAVVIRYNKNEKTGERDIAYKLTPTYVTGVKHRVMYSLINKAKNYTMPVVFVTLNSIKMDKERIVAKHNTITRYINEIAESYDMPVPVTISLSVTILSKLLTDLYQIYGKLCTQFRPYCTFSWYVPKSDTSIYEELRSKVEWQGDLSLENRDKIEGEEEEKYTGKMSFDITGWIFPNSKGCRNNIILDIGTDKYIDMDLAERIYSETIMDRPLFIQYLQKSGKKYNNPREFANGHPLISNAFICVKSPSGKLAYFILDDIRAANDVHSLDFKNCQLLIEGYNFSENTQVIIKPAKNSKISVKSKKVEYSYGDSKLLPLKEQNKFKPSDIGGYPIEANFINSNKISIDLKQINNSGEFDIIICDNVDYDLLSNCIGSTLMI